MKLRIKGNSIRLRLSQTEVASFGKTGICFDKTFFGINKLTYQLHKADVEAVKAEFSNFTISVAVPDAIADSWVKNETQVGFEHKQQLPDKSELLILVEKDFACLASRTNEDESDNFPNPLAGKEQC